MNSEVQELLEKKKKEHLISSGFIDKNKKERKYDPDNLSNVKYDQAERKYYIERYVAMDVTDEEFAEICKLFPIDSNESETKLLLNNLRDDVKKIKFWVVFWSILSIASAIIAIFVVLAD